LKLLVTILVFFWGLSLNAQTYNYSYTDPCTGIIKSIVVPVNGTVTVGYYGEISQFSQSDFTNGTFESWTNNIFSQYGQDSPCSQIVGIGTAVNVTQSTALNVVGILNSLSTISDMASGATNMLGGAVGSVTNTSSGENNNKNNKNGNNNSTNSNNSTSGNSGVESNGTSGSSTNVQTSPQETGSGESGGTTSSTGTEGGTSSSSSEPTSSSSSSTTTEPTGEGSTSTETSSSTEGTSSQGNTSGNSSTGEGSQTETQEVQTPPKESEGKTNITAGATTTVKSTPTSKEGGKPSVVASSDFVGFNFKNSEVKTGLKVTGGYTASRWDGKRSYGVLADYTSALKGPNITGFYAWIKPKHITLLSGTVTIGFEGNKSLYGTIAGGQMFSFKKVKSLKVIYMATVSYGAVYRTPFTGTAVIGGAMYDWKVSKRLDIKLTDLLVYAPYVSYYNDVVMKSPYVMLPSIGINVGITKKFKFNINAGGAWDLKTAALNYTVTCGTRILVGQ
jgi:hypothetical protein